MKIAVFFPKKKQNTLDAIMAGDHPDKLSALSKFKDFGMDFELFDPMPFPLNPLARMHSLYSGIDPIRSLIFLFKKKDIDIILCVGESSALCFLWLTKYLGVKFPPIVVWDPALTISWDRRLKMLKYVLPKVSKIVVLGRNQCDFIESHIGRNDSVVLPHWIDCDYFSPSYCVSEKKQDYILAVGDDVSRDYALLEEAVRELPVTVVIVTRKYKSKYNKNLKIITKYLSFNDLRELYCNALFVVIPLDNVSHAGGINAIQEAMAMGKGTVVSLSEGIEDYVNDDTSLKVVPHNNDEMKKAISRLLNDEPLRIKQENAARSFVEENYACYVLASGFKRLFDELVEN